MTEAQIHVTKLAAAQRMLKSAIRMFFASEDELATHTVASSAYQILSDLKDDRVKNKDSRGQVEAEDRYLMDIFYIIREYRRGVLPNQFTSDPEMMQYIRRMARSFSSIRENSKIENFKLSLPLRVVRSYWSKRKKVYNFLKHADRDANKRLSTDEINNLDLLVSSAASYMDLAKDDLDIEGAALWAYVCAKLGISQDTPDHIRGVATRLESLNDDERLKVCLDWINIAHENSDGG